MTSKLLDQQQPASPFCCVFHEQPWQILSSMIVLEKPLHSFLRPLASAHHRVTCCATECASPFSGILSGRQLSSGHLFMSRWVVGLSYRVVYHRDPVPNFKVKPGRLASELVHVPGEIYIEDGHIQAVTRHFTGEGIAGDHDWERYTRASTSPLLLLLCGCIRSDIQVKCPVRGMLTHLFIHQCHLLDGHLFSNGTVC